MKESARWNIQHNIEEDKRFIYKTYNIESPLDYFIIQRVKNRQSLCNTQEYNKTIDEIGKDIAAAVDKALL